MTKTPNLLRSLAQHMHAYSDQYRDTQGLLPPPREIRRRLTPFNIDGSSPEHGYLAVCYKNELRDAEGMGFDDRDDTILYALGQVALQRVLGWDAPGFSLKLETVLYDDDSADLYGGMLIESLPARVQRAAESVLTLDEYRQLHGVWPTSEYIEQTIKLDRDLDKTLRAATLLALLSGNDDLEYELFEVLRHPSIIRLGPRAARKRHTLASELFATGASDPHMFREQMRRELADLHMGRYSFLERYRSLDERHGVGHYAEDADAECPDAGNAPPAARLTFTILPDAEGISGFVTERVRFHASRPSGARFVADSQRTDVLTMLATDVGPERCTLYRSTSTTEVRSLDGENITEDYLVLVIDQNGGEDAVAISPARGRHATFVVRHDVSTLPWHEVFALPKRSATDLGAKRMRFQGRWPMDEYEAMFEKVSTALTCPPERFGEKFGYSDDLGRYLL